MQPTTHTAGRGPGKTAAGDLANDKARHRQSALANRARWKRVDAAIFSRQFSQLLAAGVSVTDSLQELAGLEPNAHARLALYDIRSRVAAGQALSEALSAYPRLFPVEYSAAVQAGERAGQLADCFEQLAEHLHWLHGSLGKLKTALGYPLFAMCFLLAAVLFVLLYLVPAMLPFLHSLGHMPLLTRVLVNASALLHEKGLQVLLATLSGIVLLWITRSFHKPGAVLIDRLLLRGALGSTLLQLSVARYARLLSLLYAAGVSLTDAMALSENIINNRALRAGLRTAREEILAGSTMSQAMQRQALLPRLFVRMVHAGEKGGVLETGLYQVAFQLQMNGQNKLDRVERLLGPWLLCLLGGVLILLVLAILGPVYDSLSTTGVAL